MSASRQIAAPAEVIFELIADPSQQWELESADEAHVLVTHTYDLSRLTDDKRLARARATTADKLRSSLDRLAELAHDEGNCP